MNNRPILLPATSVVDERGYLVKPAFVVPSTCELLVVRDVYVSSSKKGVFRGLHYQKKPYEQEKLFTPLSGKYTIYCVRTSTPAEVIKFRLIPEDHKSAYIPKGWATGLLAEDDHNTILYCSPQEYCRSAECGISYAAIPELARIGPTLSLKDKSW